MKMVKILWAGLDNSDGQRALGQKGVSEVEIVAGLSRRGPHVTDASGVSWYPFDGLYHSAFRMGEFDVIVDFSSHPDTFYQVVNFAVREEVPLVIRTSDISEQQMKTLYEATKLIPIFRSKEFRFVRPDATPIKGTFPAKSAMIVAKIMAKKPVRKHEFYDLGDIWEEFSSYES